MNSSINRILENKYFKAVVLFLAASNVLGYIFTHNIASAIFFGLVWFLISKYSNNENNTAALLGAMFMTAILITGKGVREGLENNDDSTDTTDTDTTDTDKIEAVDPKLGKGVLAMKKHKTAAGTKVALKKVAAAKEVAAKNNLTTDEVTDDTEDPETIESFEMEEDELEPSGNKAFNGGFVPSDEARIDYSSTLQDAYTNLDKMLGTGGMKNLTKDTKNLMNQQKALFETMKGMTPLLASAKDMLKGFDMKSINSLMGKQ